MALLRAPAFRTASQAAAYVGLVPSEHQSGSSVYKPPRLSKAGEPSIRVALYTAAVLAIQRNPDIRCLYERLLERGKKQDGRPRGRHAQTGVQIACGVLKNRQEYGPQGA
jgi:transposase